MEFILCPDCFGSNFTELFICRDCEEAFSKGVKITGEQKKRNLTAQGKHVSVSNRKSFKRTFKQQIFAVAFSLLFVNCLSVLIYQAFLAGKTKSPLTISSQLSSQNELNKMAIESDEQKSLTTVTLTQENVEISRGNKKNGIVKLLFDTVYEGKSLTKTPDEYHLTIISTNQKELDLNSAVFELKTDTGAINPAKQTADQWNIGESSHEYASFEISRKDLENIALSKQTDFQIGEFHGQLNFARQQSLKSFLIATSLESKIK